MVLAEDPRKVVLMYHRADHFGPPIALDDYLQTHADKLIVARFPMGIASNQVFQVTLYQNGRQIYSKEKRIERKQDWTWKGDRAGDVLIELANQTSAMLQIMIRLTRFGREKYDMAIGTDPLCAYYALVLKKLRIARKVVYAQYNDLTPVRSENRAFNSIYNYTTKYCLNNADYVWYRWTNHREEAIKKYGSLKEKRVVMVPMGVYTKAKRAGVETNRYAAVSAREVSETAGLHLVLDALPEIVRFVPQFEVVIVGEGPYLPILKRKAQDMNIERHVRFLGRKPHDETLALIESCGIGLATYLPTAFRTKVEANSKIEAIGATVSTMEMLGAGLPVIATKGMGISYEIEREQAGVAIGWEKDQLANAVISLLTDKQRYDAMSANTKKIVNKYEWKNIFSSALRGESIVMNPPGLAPTV